MSEEKGVAIVEKNLPPPATIEMPEVVVLEEAAIKAMEEMGAVTLNRQHFSNLKSVGLHVGKGIMPIQQGQALMTQATLQATVNKLVKLTDQIVEKKQMKIDRRVKLLCAVAREINGLSSKITESGELLLRANGPHKTGEIPDQPPTVNTFQPGQQVQPGGTQIVAEQVHIHNGQKPETNGVAVAEPQHKA